MTAKQATIEIVEHSVPVLKGDAPEVIQVLRKLGAVALESARAAVERYMDLVRFIREREVLPQTVTRELKDLGFVDSRISEIKRLAFVSDAEWRKIDGEKMGFKLALQEARKGARKPKSKSEQDAEDAFRLKLCAVFEQFVPVGGKLPKWMQGFSLPVNGCVASITVRRAKKVEKELHGVNQPSN
jgi:hypothetical protein